MAHIELGDRKFLTRDELIKLVNDCRAIMAEDRYAEITIVGTREVLSQINLVTRWGKRYDLETGERVPGVVHLAYLTF